MSTDLRWQQRLEHYQQALAVLQRAVAALAAEPGNDLYAMATI
jgi:hypothetical protein